MSRSRTRGKMYLKTVFVFLTYLTYCKSNESAFYSLSATDIHNKKVSFEDFKDTVVVIVNVASECGFTDGHYKALSRLYNMMGATDKITVLGFPCNQFGAQEPGNNGEILKFAQQYYDVKFPMFSKIDVYGENQHSVYRFLEEKTGQVPNWNFWKYLVNHRGEVLGAWSPRQDVEEMMPNIVEAVKAAQAAAGIKPKPPASRADGPKPPETIRRPSSPRGQGRDDL